MKLSGELPLTRAGRAPPLNPEMNWLAFSTMLQNNIDQRALAIRQAQDAGEPEKAAVLLTAQEVLLGLQHAIVAGLHASMGD